VTDLNYICNLRFIHVLKIHVTADKILYIKCDLNFNLRVVCVDGTKKFKSI
jgi:hypothetical protein